MSIPIPFDTLLARLIRDDLRIRKLIYGLEDLGLDAEAYFPTLSTTVLMLLGYPGGHEAVYTFYEELCEEVKYTSAAENDKQLDKLAHRITRKLRHYRLAID